MEHGHVHRLNAFVPQHHLAEEVSRLFFTKQSGTRVSI
jgi:hypothetical protein